jgi:6-phosphogluconolactonase
VTPDLAARPRLLVVRDDRTASVAAAAVIEAYLAGRRRSTVAVSGGRAVLAALTQLATSPRVDWHRIDVVQADERLVDEDHPDRASAAIGAVLDGPVRAGARWHAVPLHAGAAAEYERATAHVLPVGVALLGLGADGHVASLLPGECEPDGSAFAVVGPYDGVYRLTVTPRCLRDAALRVVVASGREKAAAVRLFATEPQAAPTARSCGAPTVLVADEHAAAEVTS